MASDELDATQWWEVEGFLEILGLDHELRLINKTRNNPGKWDSIWLLFDQQATACISNLKYLCFSV